MERSTWKRYGTSEVVSTDFECILIAISFDPKFRAMMGPQS